MDIRNHGQSTELSVPALANRCRRERIAAAFFWAVGGAGLFSLAPDAPYQDAAHVNFGPTFLSIVVQMLSHLL